LLTSVFSPDSAGSHKARGAEEPSRQNHFSFQGWSFARQQDKDGLRDFIGQRRIIDVSQGAGPNEIQVSFHQSSESGFRAASDVFVNELAVVHVSNVFIIDISAGNAKADSSG
jgi:hypothetical protein